MNLASLWCLDPSVTYLNHGSFGACPSAVLEVQSALRLEMEQEPVDFLVKNLPARMDTARRALALFLGAEPEDLVFVPNATAGVNAVLRSLAFESGDELLVTSHTYAACRKTVDFVTARSGATVVVAHLPFPCRDEEEIIAAVLQCASPRTRLALLDHVTSPTALVLPIARLVGELRARGIDTLVDGAHAPGMVPLALADLDAAYQMPRSFYAMAQDGVLPKAFLRVNPDTQVQEVGLLFFGTTMLREAAELRDVHRYPDARCRGLDVVRIAAPAHGRRRLLDVGISIPARRLHCMPAGHRRASLQLGTASRGGRYHYPAHRLAAISTWPSVVRRQR